MKQSLAHCFQLLCFVIISAVHDSSSMTDSNEILLQTIQDNRHPLEYIKNLLACSEASVNFANPRNHQTALHIAAQRGDIDLIKLLFSYGAHVNGGTVDLMTPLHEACLGGHPEAVDILIAEGADVCNTVI